MTKLDPPPFFALGAGPNEPAWSLMLPRQAVVVGRVELSRSLEGLPELTLIQVEHRSAPDGQLWVDCRLRGGKCEWLVSDVVRPVGRWVRVTRTWVLEKGIPQSVALVFSVEVTGAGVPRVLLPGISYDGNPSAEASRLVPRFAEALPSRSLYEEHRYPVPLAHLEVEVTGHDGSRVPAGVALQSVPSRIDSGSGNEEESDHWWSLGAELRERGGALLLHSSSCETNGQPATVYGSQNTLHPFPAQPVRFGVGTRVQKDVFLIAASLSDAGWTWRRPVAEARRRLLVPPISRLTPEQVIAAKLNVVRSRFVQEGDVAGFLHVPEVNRYDSPRQFQWGWTGQSARLAATLLELEASPFAPTPLGSPSPAAMAHASLRFVNSQPAAAPGCPLPWVKYSLEVRRWEASSADGRFHSRQVGEVLSQLALCCEAAADAPWREAVLERLRQAAAFLVEGRCSTAEVFPACWHADGRPAEPSASTGGVACVSALARIGWLLGKPEWTAAAAARLEAYARRVLGSEPRWPCGATLDANCEDKEAGILLLRACLDVHDATGEPHSLECARRAADWTLTFMYAWDPGLRPGTFLARRMNCSGWNAVSVQNQHLDVFTPVEELLRLAAATGEEEYARLARVMVRAVTQTVATERDLCGFDQPGRPAVVGEQAEQFFQTNYYQGPFSQADWRGGFNWWNPLWIAVHPLRDALCLLRYEREHGQVKA